jgi:hypothetical protein
MYPFKEMKSPRALIKITLGKTKGYNSNSNNNVDMG